jgi:hypothetical protein
MKTSLVGAKLFHVTDMTNIISSFCQPCKYAQKYIFVWKNIKLPRVPIHRLLYATSKNIKSKNITQDLYREITMSEAF